MTNITQEMLTQAQEQENDLVNESEDILRAQVQYFQNRVVLLRAALNAMEEELKELRPTIETQSGDGVEPEVIPPTP